MAIWKDANIEEGFRCISHSGGITFGPDTEPNIYHPDYDKLSDIYNMV